MKRKNINIVFAYANDSIEFVQGVEDQIKYLNRIFNEQEIYINLKKWDNVLSRAGKPESIVLEELKIPDADIFIDLFRFSFGKPTGMEREDGYKYLSGLEQEFEIAYKARLKNKKHRPEILLYRSEEDVPQSYLKDAYDSMDSMNTFFGECESNGKHEIMYKSFSSKEEFYKMITEDLLRVILSENNLLQSCQNHYTDIYFADRNDERNKNKHSRLTSTTKIRLSAKSCYSFLNQQGRFYSEFTDLLENKVNIRVIMQNPYSFNAIVSAVGYNTLKLFHNKKITADQLLQEYHNSNWYKQRFMGSLEGYDNLYRTHRKVKNICLKLTAMDLSTSILLTDTTVFFEPYLSSIEVGKKALSIFEVEAAEGTELYKDSSKDFEDIWKNCSISYSEYKKNKDKYQYRLFQYLEEIQK